MPYKDGIYIGYERVSPDDQNLALQEYTLKQPGCEGIFYEKINGANLKR
jgi:DNA invertase Pin-like site-specific DNA recombinase